MTVHYKPNLVYVLKIDDQYYVGSHTVSRDYIAQPEIISMSGNYLNQERHRGNITMDEYKSRVKILRVEECNNKEEAFELEEKLIREAKKLLGDLCANKIVKSNPDQIGIRKSPEWKEKISNSMKIYKENQKRLNKKEEA